MLEVLPEDDVPVLVKAADDEGDGLTSDKLMANEDKLNDGPALEVYELAWAKLLDADAESIGTLEPDGITAVNDGFVPEA